MQSLASKNFSTVHVILRDETITMPADNGVKLMEYLTAENNASHVMITNTDGVQQVINKYEIKKVAPVVASTRYKTAAELGLPDLK